jgi:hypothetical protein
MNVKIIGKENAENKMPPGFLYTYSPYPPFRNSSCAGGKRYN